MILESRIEALEHRRQALKAKIAEEQRRPHPDALALVRLKKEKCAVKDKIAALSRGAETVAA
jgi:hypothetical protein